MSARRCGWWPATPRPATCSPGPEVARKLDVLRAHCDAEGRDYDDITKTCYFLFDVGEKGEKAGEVVDQLGALAELGFQAAIGGVIGPGT